MFESSHSYSEITKAYFNLLSTDPDDYANLRLRLKLPIVPLPIIQSLIKDSHDLLAKEPAFLSLTGDYVIVGDLMGSILDLLRVFRNFGTPNMQKYLFLGNYLGEKEFSVETLTLILACKAVWPQNVFLLKGQNEFKEIIQQNNLLNQFQELYHTDALTNPILRMFNFLSICAIIDDKAICMNGGFGKNFQTIEDLLGISKPIYNFNSPVVIEIIWSEPTNALPMFLPNSRYYGNLFGVQATEIFLKQNKLDMVIRGHTQVDEGIHKDFNGKVFTAFTASNYLGKGNKSGALRYNQGVSAYQYCSHPNLTRMEVVFIESSDQNSFNMAEHSVAAKNMKRRQTFFRNIINEQAVSSARSINAKPRIRPTKLANKSQSTKEVPRKSLGSGDLPKFQNASIPQSLLTFSTLVNNV